MLLQRRATHVLRDLVTYSNCSKLSQFFWALSSGAALTGLIQELILDNELNKLGTYC